MVLMKAMSTPLRCLSIVVVVLLAVWPSDLDNFKLAAVGAIETNHLNNLDHFLNKLDQLTSSVSGHQSKNKNERDSEEEDSPDNELANDSGQSLSPIILVPGYCGSRLEAKWNKSHVEQTRCEAYSDWTTIWVDFKQLLPVMIDCLIENLRLVFDGTTNTTHNTPGVDIRVQDPDDISSIEYLSDFRLPSFSYFYHISRRLTGKLGYKRNDNLRGAPYDFRKAPNELGDYFDKMKDTTEEMFHQSQGTPVSYICHSMGCINLLYFMQKQTKDWKDKHVKRIISIAAPWGGSLSALKAVAVGDNLDMPHLFDQAKMNILQRSLPSTISLFPNPRGFANSQLVTTNLNNPKESEVFGTKDYKTLFDKMHHPDGYKMWLQTKDLVGNLQAPGVELWCIYGQSQRTLGRLEFMGDFPNSKEIHLYDDGDGTVTIQSARYCQRWSSQQPEPVHVKGFHTNHNDLLRVPKVMATIESIIKTGHDVRDVRDGNRHKILDLSDNREKSSGMTLANI